MAWRIISKGVFFALLLLVPACSHSDATGPAVQPQVATHANGDGQLNAGELRLAFPRGGELLDETGKQPADAVPQYVQSPEEIAALEAANADPNFYRPGELWIGEPGITETVEEIMIRDNASPQPRFTSEDFIALEEHETPWRRHLDPASDSPAVSQWPPRQLEETSNEAGESPDRQGVTPRIPQTTGVEFIGVPSNQSGYVPPDTNADVGLTQIVAIANGRIKVFTKTGVADGLSTSLNTFFNSVRGGSIVADPWVRYDRLTNRWFVIAITGSTPNRIVIAVSNTSIITTLSSFTFYFFQQDLVGATPNADTGAFADYPSLGVDNNALYIGANMFAPGFAGTSAWVVRKSSVLSGGPIVVSAFRRIANGFGQGPFAPRGVQNDDPSATEGYFIGPSNSFLNQLVMRRVSDPGGKPSISGNIFVGGVPTTNNPTAVPVLGSTAPLDALDDRLFVATIFHNQLTGLRTLWTAHSFRVSATGVATSSGNRIGSRWYEIEDLTTSPVVRQAGTVFDDAASNFDRYWVPSIAMNEQGHAALGCSVGGDARRAEIAVAGRHNDDPLGTLQTSIIAEGTTFNYNAEGGVQRWGDYSSTSLDPVDGMTLWTAQEYCNATNSWATRIIQLIAPPPADPTSAFPPTLPVGASNENVVVTGTVVSGSGFFDPDVSYPNHISTSVSGGDVTVNSVTFTDPTTITLNLTVSVAAAVGPRSITVTNPDGQSITSANGIISIVPSCNLLGDLNEDTFIDALDVQPFVDCLLTGVSGGNCACGDFDGLNMVDIADVPSFVTALGL
ncbi:MAG: hypothetical protein HS101_06445 [Planctomycetia bacterium]|jgi:hypothetical protein|nr:hypothetical protein [Planctomycetia bacterium]MCC7314141.1 hypothetical protein [Planctomycetota bacterium]OQZ05779.1 MAG: hypothetical protein B6D36_08410 [Planctomycetes bacterium UTPLA1]